MKKLIFLFTLFLAASKLSGQDCSQYVFMKKGRTIEMTSFNAGGNIIRRAVMLINDVTTANGITTATVEAQNFDKNGQPRSKNTVTYKCNNGTLNIDISAMMPQQGNFQLSTAYFKYPPGMKVGDHFENVTMTMTMNMGSKTVKSTTIVTDRTVADQESVTTPAGTWTCFRMTYKMTTTMEGLNALPYTTMATEWYVPNFGIVEYQTGAMVTKMTAIKD
jgi:hypothetical protein